MASGFGSGVRSMGWVVGWWEREGGREGRGGGREGDRGALSLALSLIFIFLKYYYMNKNIFVILRVFSFKKYKTCFSCNHSMSFLMELDGKDQTVNFLESLGLARLKKKNKNRDQSVTS